MAFSLNSVGWCGVKGGIVAYRWDLGAEQNQVARRRVAVNEATSFFLTVEVACPELSELFGIRSLFKAH